MTVLTAWIREQGADGTRILFPSARGGRLSADAVQHLVAKHAATAQQICPSLADKHVSPHVLRHTTAMELMQAGVDRTLIALWLGHESVETTQIYLDANLSHQRGGPFQNHTDQRQSRAAINPTMTCWLF